jgi:hypothetical protein
MPRFWVDIYIVKNALIHYSKMNALVDDCNKNKEGVFLRDKRKKAMM